MDLYSALLKLKFFGLTILAAMHPNFPCRAALDSLSRVRHPAIEILLGTFGEDFTCVEKFSKRFGKRAAIFIHPYNNTCYRFPRRCYREDIPPATYFRLGKLMQRFRELRATYGVRLYLSLGLEDGYSLRVARLIQKRFREDFPEIPTYRNSLSHDYRGALFGERHGDGMCRGGKEKAVSLDGTKLSERSFVEFPRKAFASGCRAVFLWAADWQGKFRRGRKFERPTTRHFVFGSKDQVLVRESYERTR